MVFFSIFFQMGEDHKNHQLNFKLQKAKEKPAS